MSNETLSRIISRFDINMDGERRVDILLSGCLKPELYAPRYVNHVLNCLSMDVNETFPYYEVSQFDTIHGRPVVITLDDEEFDPVYLDDDEE